MFISVLRMQRGQGASRYAGDCRREALYRVAHHSVTRRNAAQRNDYVYRMPSHRARSFPAGSLRNCILAIYEGKSPAKAAAKWKPLRFDEYKEFVKTSEHRTLS
jgi:hypothetical protein